MTTLTKHLNIKSTRRNVFQKIWDWLYSNIFWRVYDFYKRLKNLFVWFKIIWNDKDWDSVYLMEIFKFKMERMLKYFEEGDSILAESERQRVIEGLRTSIKLIQKAIIDEEYSYEFVREIESIYGERNFVFKDIEENPNLKSLEIEWKVDYTEEQIKELEEKINNAYRKGSEKQKKAQELTFKFINHRFREWWD